MALPGPGSQVTPESWGLSRGELVETVLALAPRWRRRCRPRSRGDLVETVLALVAENGLSAARIEALEAEAAREPGERPMVERTSHPVLTDVLVFAARVSQGTLPLGQRSQSMMDAENSCMSKTLIAHLPR